MAIKALNPFEPVWYTPKDEVDDENPTRFKIKGMNGVQFADVASEFILDDKREIQNISKDGAVKALKYGLVDWENFANDKGTVKFTKNINMNLQFIPYELIIELAMEIVAISDQTEDERKN